PAVRSHLRRNDSRRGSWPPQNIYYRIFTTEYLLQRCHPDEGGSPQAKCASRCGIPPSSRLSGQRGMTAGEARGHLRIFTTEYLLQNISYRDVIPTKEGAHKLCAPPAVGSLL